MPAQASEPQVILLHRYRLPQHQVLRVLKLDAAVELQLLGHCVTLEVTFFEELLYPDVDWLPVCAGNKRFMAESFAYPLSMYVVL